MQFSKIKGGRLFAFIFLCATLFACASDVAAQQQRSRRRSRRRPARVVVVPPPAQPTGAPLRDAEVVGSAENLAGQENAAGVTSETSTTTAGATADPLQRTIEKLSEQVAELTKKINQLEDQKDVSADFERLQRAEQRAEALQVQLRQLQEKEMNLRARSEQLDYEMRPESLMRRTEMIGSVNPEAMRQQFRQQLERDKQLVTTQLEQLAASRARLDAAIASSDTYVERLRKRVELEERPPVADEEEAASQATPEPSPTQPENLP